MERTMANFKTIDKRWKISTTDTHVYFVGSPFSQWWIGKPFSGELIVGEFAGVVDVSNCAEQYMMASKASLFGDREALDAIQATNDPKEQKAIGRRIKNFDAEKWAAVARDCVTQGNIYKFTQDEDLGRYLLSTGDKTLVEGAWYDPVWGVKLAWDDPAILDEANWQGTNWLGECLMRVRAKMMADLLDRIHPGHQR
jgi:ribA/ribD-fused uncharacterized protein